MTTTYLLAISIGPVQEFIASARKTADLSAGSGLLVDVVGAAVQYLERQGATFIFPSDPKSTGANKILVQVTGDPAKLAQEAKAAAQEFLHAQFNKVVQGQEKFIDLELAREQLAHFLEFYAAWVARTDSYAADRSRVERLLAGRKNLREFSAFSHGAGIPKSPLDPALACIFNLEGLEGQGPWRIPDKLKERFSLKNTEYLDAISLLKREYGRKNTHATPTNELAQGATTSADLDPSQKKRVLATNELAQRATIPAFTTTTQDEEYTPTYPYFAILVADGDSMGKKLSDLEQGQGEAGLEAHQQFSRKLDDFANEAKGIITSHDGYPIYTGGDDVLALLPVTEVLACADKLRQAFADNTDCTLSAGIAIVHYREPLSTSLTRARAAEKKAKAVDGKNAVCVALHTRGGAPLVISEKWDNVSQLVKCFTQSVAGEIPRGLAYELQTLAHEWPSEFETDVLHAEAQRIADRKKNQDGLQAAVQIPKLSTKKELEQLAKQMILARFLSGKGDYL